MNSEKVKEIKKGLEVCNGLCGEDCPYHSVGCMNDLSKDALTLINELESENERLNKSDTSKEESSIEYYNLYKDLKRKNKDLNELCELQRVSIAENFVRENQLKDQIAELEEQIRLAVEKAKKETAKEIIKTFALSPRTRAMIAEKYGLTKQDLDEV
jgi:DNA repair exonuclease SbcCD ATPase subunit